jgi:hypothetical protein
MAPARLRSVIGDDERERDHAERGEQNGQRTDRPGQRSDDAEEKGDVDERPDAETLADELHEPEAAGSQLAGGSGRFTHAQPLIANRGVIWNDGDKPRENAARTCGDGSKLDPAAET